MFTSDVLAQLWRARRGLDDVAQRIDPARTIRFLLELLLFFLEFANASLELPDFFLVSWRRPQPVARRSGLTAGEGVRS